MAVSRRKVLLVEVLFEEGLAIITIFIGNVGMIAVILAMATTL